MTVLFCDDSLIQPAGLREMAVDGNGDCWGPVALKFHVFEMGSSGAIRSRTVETEGQAGSTFLREQKCFDVWTRVTRLTRRV